MIFNILNNKTAWKLIALFSYSPGAGFTREEIKNLLNWNNSTLDRAIEKLFFYKILKKERRVIKFNFNNNNILNLFEEEKQRLNYPSFELFLLLNDFIRYCENETCDIYLFGSHAKKTASVNSDIDIAVYCNKDFILAIEKIYDEYNKKIQIHNIIKNTKLDKEVKKHGVKLI
jgi:predicted nucleotidyltransferase